MGKYNSVELSSLVRLHELTGVDRLSETRQLYEWGGDEACQVIRFVLDGVSYAAIEDPNDGYRSSMGELFVSDTSVVNTFSPVQVLGSMCEGVIEFRDTENGKVVLSVGTDHSDGYYPFFVAEFNPENMSVIAVGHADGISAAKAEVEAYLRRNALGE